MQYKSPEKNIVITFQFWSQVKSWYTLNNGDLLICVFITKIQISIYL